MYTCSLSVQRYQSSDNWFAASDVVLRFLSTSPIEFNANFAKLDPIEVANPPSDDANHSRMHVNPPIDICGTQKIAFANLTCSHSCVHSRTLFSGHVLIKLSLLERFSGVIKFTQWLSVIVVIKNMVLFTAFCQNPCNLSQISFKMGMQVPYIIGSLKILILQSFQRLFLCWLSLFFVKFCHHDMLLRYLKWQ